MRCQRLWALATIGAALVVSLATDVRPTRAAEAVDVARGEAPAWVVPREVPLNSASLSSQSEDGIAWLLLDSQTKATADGYEEFEHTVRQVIDRSGLESAGSIEIEFDPKSESVTLSHLRIVRDGKVIDHTAGVKLELIRRESNLDDGLIDGRVTAVGNIPDVRVGDIIDYATIDRVTDKLWPGHFFTQRSTRYSVAVGMRALRITWPASRPILIKPINTDLSLSHTKVGEMNVYEVIQRAPSVQSAERNVPDWRPQYGLLSLSTMSSWQEVADWAAPLYRGDETLPADLARELDAMAARWAQPFDRLTEATRLVQDRVRYVGVEIGEGSFVPRRPREVVRQGYGDCKDKALLLAVVLRRLGIDAVPSLVSTGWGPGLPAWAPSPAVFDHVIVRVVIDGKVFWIDPTLTHEGGRGASLVTPDYGYVLPIRAGQRELELIRTAPKVDDDTKVVERFDIDEASDPILKITVETVRRGGDANWMRRQLAVDTVANFSKKYVGYYDKYYPGLSVAKPLQVIDDRDANIIRTVESYAVSKAAFEKGKFMETFILRAEAVLDVLPEKQATDRRNPLALRANLRRTHVIEVAAKGRTPQGLADLSREGAGVNFARTSRLEGERTIFTFVLTTGLDEVAAKDAKAVYAVTDAIDDEAYIQYRIDQLGKSFATVFQVDPVEIAPFDARLREAVALMQKNDSPSRTQSLTLLNAMGAEARRPSKVAGLIDGLIGLVLTDERRYPAALAALTSAASQYQENVGMLNVLLALQMDAGKPIEAAGTLEVIARRHPEGLGKVDERNIRSLRSILTQAKSDAALRANDDLTVALAQAGWQQSPPTAMGSFLRSEAIRTLLERGRAAEAGKLFAAAPVSAQTAAALAVDNRYQALWADLEKPVKDRFRTLLAQDVARSREAVAKAPTDLKALTQLAWDLRSAGDPAAAVAAAKAVAADRARIEAAGEEGFALVETYALSLFEAGHAAEAVAEMDWLVGLGVARYPTLVSQVIDRAGVLMAADRFTDALLAYDEAADIADRFASPFGRMWIWAGTVCSADQLGKEDVATAAMAKLQAAPSDNRGAHIQALACLGDEARLQEAVIARLDDPRERAIALLGFAVTARKPQGAVERETAAQMARARAAPAVQAKFKAYGRALTFDGSPQW